MIEKIEAFLNQQLQAGAPLLLGFSGGSDSMALAHLLVDLEVPFHLAHFDHGWREESRREVDWLRGWAKGFHLPFHTERWENPELSELAARNVRYKFFEKMFQTRRYQALVLAHHIDDQGEVVLKRLLEGAHFHNFKAMKEVSLRGKMPIWRPLLTSSKKEILQYLKEKKAPYFEDVTNGDLKYLRSRMRKQILPYLSEHFGKNITAPLARLSEYGAQLSDYLEEKTKRYSIRHRPRGPYYDFRGAHPMEIDFVLSRSPFPTPSHHSLKKIHMAVQKKLLSLRISDDWLADEGLLYWISPSSIKKGSAILGQSEIPSAN